MSRLTIIVAATRSNGIGVNSRLPWRLPKEMEYFTQVTTTAPPGQQNVVVMGRISWESIPKKYRPLANRFNVVVSRNKNYDIGMPNDSSARVEHDISSALRVSEQSPDPKISIHRRFITGGVPVYSETLALRPLNSDAYVDRILLTRILSPEFDECDVFMPDFMSDNESKWIRAPHVELQDWVGFHVPEGVQVENGVNYEFQMWTRSL